MSKKLYFRPELEANSLEETNPEVINQYKEKYEKAAKEAGIDKSTDAMAIMIKEIFIINQIYKKYFLKI